MANINIVKESEMQEIIDFYYYIKEYGHIVSVESKLLEIPFNKILEGMRDVCKLMDDSYCTNDH
jgi:hypothetical protein